jgi:hypothetical protein
MGRACAINCTTGAALILLGSCFGPETTVAASSGGTHDTIEKAIPQGKDPPGTDEEQRTAHERLIQMHHSLAVRMAVLQHEPCREN